MYIPMDDADGTYSLTFVPGTRGNQRCHCCNRVNNPDISDELSEVTMSRMVFDPKDNTKVYCMDCVDEMLEANSEFLDED